MAKRTATVAPSSSLSIPGLEALLGQSWEDCMRRVELAGIDWVTVNARVEALSRAVSLSRLEARTLLAVFGNQISGDTWMPMLSSIEELSAHLVIPLDGEKNTIASGLARIVREGWIVTQPDQKLRVHPVVVSFFVHEGAEVCAQIAEWSAGLSVLKSSLKAYPLWKDADAVAMSQVIKSGAFKVICHSSDVYRDRLEVARLCAQTGRPLVFMDGMRGEPAIEPVVVSILRAVDAVIGLVHGGELEAAQYRKIIEAMDSIGVVVFVDEHQKKTLQRPDPHTIDMFPQSLHARGELWRVECAERGIVIFEDDLVRLQSLFTFDLEKIDHVLHALTVMRLPVTFDNVAILGRRQGSQMLEGFSKKVEPRYDWDDLVLPPRTKLKLAEIYQYIANRSKVEKLWDFKTRHNRGHGVTVVFEGESGTGKTMAAEVLAKALGLNLFQVDLSKLTSKYVGDTEKNLSLVFAAARDACGILFFDEGEALFSKRSETQSSQDRYANLEVNFLLQELETYDGIVVISTNLAQNIDEAFLRRITFQIAFPKPDQVTRESIWRAHLSRGLPLHEDVDFPFLGRLPVSGGVIKNIVAIAASWAAMRADRVTMKDILWGVRREFSKLGLSLDRETFGEVYWKHVSPEWESVHAAKRQQELRPHAF